MRGEILLKLVTVLTPDDVRRMKAAGLAWQKPYTAIKSKKEEL